VVTKVRKFAYYRKLTARQKRIYDKSDAITELKLSQASRFGLCVRDLNKWLAAENKTEVQKAAQRLANGLSEVFEVPRVVVKVLARRPSRNWGELHGLYEAEEDAHPVITVWMRTAQRKQVVAFKTFLRTIIHEFMHHLDYARFRLADSFHTEGFYKRESALIKDLMRSGGMG
jgi:hypothetical protein